MINAEKQKSNKTNIPKATKSIPEEKIHGAWVRVARIILATVGSIIAAFSSFFPGRPMITPPTFQPAAEKVIIKNDFNEGANANIKMLLEKLNAMISELAPFPHIDSDSSVEAWKSKLIQYSDELKEILESLVQNYISVTERQLKTSLAKLSKSLSHVIQEIDDEFTRLSRQELSEHLEDLVGTINEILETLEKQEDNNKSTKKPVAGTKPPDIQPK